MLRGPGCGVDAQVRSPALLTSARDSTSLSLSFLIYKNRAKKTTCLIGLCQGSEICALYLISTRLMFIFTVCVFLESCIFQIPEGLTTSWVQIRRCWHLYPNFSGSLCPPPDKCLSPCRVTRPSPHSVEGLGEGEACLVDPQTTVSPGDFAEHGSSLPTLLQETLTALLPRVGS